MTAAPPPERSRRGRGPRIVAGLCVFAALAVIVLAIVEQRELRAAYWLGRLRNGRAEPGDVSLWRCLPVVPPRDPRLRAALKLEPGDIAVTVLPSRIAVSETMTATSISFDFRNASSELRVLLVGDDPACRQEVVERGADGAELTVARVKANLYIWNARPLALAPGESFRMRQHQALIDSSIARRLRQNPTRTYELEVVIPEWNGYVAHHRDEPWPFPMPDLPVLHRARIPIVLAPGAEPPP